MARSDNAPRSKAEVVFEASGQAPSPSKNYYQVVVTKSLVTLRWWPISFHLGSRAKPGERRVPCDEYDDDKRTADEIRINLGQDIEERVSRFSRGVIDPLSRLPKELLLRILGNVDLSDLSKVECCNKYLHETCKSDALWERIYLEHHGWISDELRELAQEVTWRKLFFTNKLQLQLMLSRRRRAASAKDRQPMSTFVTEMGD